MINGHLMIIVWHMDELKSFILNGELGEDLFNLELNK